MTRTDLRTYPKNTDMTSRLWALLIIVLIVVALLGLLVLYNVREFLREETCLDRGGRWKADQSVCEYLPRPGEGTR